MLSDVISSLLIHISPGCESPKGARVMNATGTVTVDESVGRSALRKASLRLIPLIGLGYAAAYIDRVNISFAALQMNRDLHFSAAMYGLGAGLFFMPYAAFEIPSNLLLCRFGARRWLARIMFTWGLVAMSMLLVRTPAQFYTVRLLLGFAEAGFFPGVIFYLMGWFPPEQRARTISRFYIALPLSQVLMGLIAGALMGLDGRLGLRGWQWLFLVEGIPPILLSIAFLTMLPDSPKTARWLTDAEREWLERGRDRQQRVHGLRGSLSALGDSRVWLLGVFNLMMLASAYAYVFVMPDMVRRATHLSTAKVGYITAALSSLGVVAMLWNAAVSDRTVKPVRQITSRIWFILPACVGMSAGFLLCGFTERPWVVLPGLALVIVSHHGMQGPLWALPGAFLSGTSAAAGVAAINMIGIIGGFLGPDWIGFARDVTGDYQRGMLVMSLPMMFGAAIMGWIWWRAKQAETAGEGAAPDAGPVVLTAGASSDVI